MYDRPGTNSYLFIYAQANIEQYLIWDQATSNQWERNMVGSYRQER